MTLYATLLIVAMLNNPYYINYVSPSEDYTMDIAQSIEPKRYEQKNGYLDVFQYIDTVDGNNGPGYMLTVLKTKPSNTFNYSSLTTKEFQQGYEDGCKCKVTSYDDVQYQKEKGISYSIKYKKSKVAMTGYTVTFRKGSNLYLVNFSTTEESMKAHYDDYFHAMNSFDLHPVRVMVNGGKYTNHSSAGN